MRLLSGTFWGADIFSLLKYRVLIRQIIEYGFEMYLSSPLSVLKRIQKLQNSALRICCGAMKSSPTIASQHFCGEYLITIKRLFSCLLYRYHILSLQNHPCRNQVTHNLHEIFPDSPRLHAFNMLTRDTFPVDIIFAHKVFLPDPPWTYPFIPIELSLLQSISEDQGPDVVKLLYVQHIQEHYSKYLVICTDGSRNDGGCGSSFFILTMNLSNHTGFHPFLRLTPPNYAPFSDV